MAAEGERKGKKRSKAFYRKSTFGAKRSCSGANVLQPGIRGFLVMCNNNESSAVRESYNILNEYADLIFGEEKKNSSTQDASSALGDLSDIEDDDCDDMEKALKKEVDGIKNVASHERRFQNVATKAKNCVFIRSTIPDPVKLVTNIMEDIALKRLKRARYAARILPILGTCKAHTDDIRSLGKHVLQDMFSSENPNAPSSYTVLFKARNNNGNTCGKTSVVPALTGVVSEINPSVKFSWSDYEMAVLVEVVCTVCCIGIAPDYNRLRKYNLQELQQGPKLAGEVEKAADSETENNVESVCEGSEKNESDLKDGSVDTTDSSSVKENDLTGVGTNVSKESLSLRCPDNVVCESDKVAITSEAVKSEMGSGESIANTGVQDVGLCSSEVNVEK